MALRIEPREDVARYAGAVSRRTATTGRLIDRLDAVRNIILVRAPAGFGKTRLCRHWYDRLIDAGRHATWLTLRDAHGSSPLTSALAEAVSIPCAGAAHDIEATLFLDDCQQLGADAELLLRRFLDGKQPQLRVVLASRTKPDIGVARRAVEGELVEVGVEQLRLSEADIKAMLVKRGALDPALCASVARLTDGWPAAVGLAVRCIEEGVSGSADLVDCLLRPSGQFADYFEEEVLAGLDDASRTALLETGTLGRFTGELTAAATGMTHPEETLVQLQSAGMFLRSEADDWRSYNPLVGAYLEAKLRREAPDRSRAIHEVASRWHSDHGTLCEAIAHAFAARDVDKAAELLVRASDTHERIGRWRAFTSWTARLTPEMLDRHPSVRLEAACAHAVLFEFDAARTSVEAVRAKLDLLSSAECAALAATEAIIAAFADRPDKALAAGERGRQEHDDADPYTRGVFRSASALGHIARGELDRARHLCLEARAIHENSGNRFGTTFSFALSGLAAAVAGDLPAAVAEWRRGMAVIRHLDTAPAIEAVAAGYLPLAYYEWNDLDEAEKHLARCFSSSVEVALPDTVASLYVVAARIAAARGEASRLAAILDEAKVVGLRRGWMRLVEIAAWERIAAALRQGDLDEAKALRERLARDARASGQLFGTGGLEIEGDVGAYRYDAATAPDRALLARIRAAITKASAQGRHWRAVRLLAIEAVARETFTDRSGALRAIRRALELGAPGRLVRSFVDEGPIAIGLVRIVAEEENRVASGVFSVSYLADVLAAAGEAPARLPARSERIEALSKRETEVLTMVGAGLSNRELAARLFVSENTVKWHLQHVFAKLGVANRTSALAVARNHGFIGEA